MVSNILVICRNPLIYGLPLWATNNQLAILGHFWAEKHPLFLNLAHKSACNGKPVYS